MKDRAIRRLHDAQPELAAAPTLASAIYEGTLRHRRHAPHAHAFAYRLFMMYLDLGEIELAFERHRFWSVDRTNLAEFRRSDYFGDAATPLDVAVRDRAEARTGRRPAGPIRMLTHLRYFGYVFNPVTFYYCFAHDGETLEVIVAEITNTPWRERHAYVLPVSDAVYSGANRTWLFAKRFHVSPFMAMEHDYRWRFNVPNDVLRVHMDVLCRDGASPPERRFDATLSLQRRSLDSTGLARVLMRHPAMTLKIIGAIHWQALRTRLAGNPVHCHPNRRGARV